MGTVAEITEAEAQEIIRTSSVPVLLDVFAVWCGPCKVLGGALEKIAPKYDGRVKIIKVNIDRNPVFKRKYANSGVPKMVLFKNGQQVDQMLGAQTIPAIENMLNKHASAGSMGESTPASAPGMDWLVKPKAE